MTSTATKGGKVTPNAIAGDQHSLMMSVFVYVTHFVVGGLMIRELDHGWIGGAVWVFGLLFGTWYLIDGLTEQKNSIIHRWATVIMKTVSFGAIGGMLLGGPLALGIGWIAAWVGDWHWVDSPIGWVLPAMCLTAGLSFAAGWALRVLTEPVAEQQR